MLREMPAEQFEEWRAFDELEPIGGRRGDWQAASVVATLYNLQRNRTAYPEPFSPETFLLDYDKESAPPPKAAPGKSWQEMKMLAQMAAASMGPENRRGRRN